MKKLLLLLILVVFCGCADETWYYTTREKNQLGITSYEVNKSIDVNHVKPMPLTHEPTELNTKVNKLTERVNKLEEIHKPIIRKWGDKIGENGEVFCE